MPNEVRSSEASCRWEKDLNNAHHIMTRGQNLLKVLWGRINRRQINVLVRVNGNHLGKK